MITKSSVSFSGSIPSKEMMTGVYVSGNPAVRTTMISSSETLTSMLSRRRARVHTSPIQLSMDWPSFIDHGGSDKVTTKLETAAETASMMDLCKGVPYGFWVGVTHVGELRVFNPQDHLGLTSCLA